MKIIRDAKLFEFVYEETVYEREAKFGGMDSELTGRTHQKQRKWHVVTYTPDMAQAAWNSETGVSEGRETGFKVLSGPVDVTPWFNLYSLL